jgi:hypothetical protein
VKTQTYRVVGEYVSACKAVKSGKPLRKLLKRQPVRCIESVTLRRRGPDRIGWYVTYTFRAPPITLRIIVKKVTKPRRRLSTLFSMEPLKGEKRDTKRNQRGRGRAKPGSTVR